MLKKFSVKNYRNFSNTIEIDFSKVGGYRFNQNCIQKDFISKMLIYGRNATGKTNLGKSILDIKNNIIGLSFSDQNDMTFANADSNEKMADFYYEFQFNDDSIIYKYSKKNDTTLIEEEMILNGQKLFYYNYESDEQFFDNLYIVKAETVVIERFLEAVASKDSMEMDIKPAVSFLRFLINNTALDDESVLLKLNEFVMRMQFINTEQANSRYFRSQINNFYKELEDEKKLRDFEDFLNAMCIPCKLVLEKFQDGKSQLYFKHKTLVPFFETASSGTKSLTRLYMQFLSLNRASLLYLDEYDAFYHYEMSEKVLKLYKEKYPETQVIMTTHNTNLMTNQIMRPDCLFILSQYGKLTALCDATNRELREGHNLEKLYTSGEFEKYE